MTDDHHSFYEHALDVADRDAFEDAHHVDGLDDEVALLRLQVRRLIEEGDPDPKVLQSGIRLLIQALAARHRLSGAQAENLSAAAANLLEQFAAITVSSDISGGDA